MTGKTEVHLADNKEGISLLDIELPFHFIKPDAAEKAKFISYLKNQIQELKAKVRHILQDDYVAGYVQQAYRGQCGVR